MAKFCNSHHPFDAQRLTVVTWSQEDFISEHKVNRVCPFSFIDNRSSTFEPAVSQLSNSLLYDLPRCIVARLVVVQEILQQLYVLIKALVDDLALQSRRQLIEKLIMMESVDR
jgi:hypothetical protein